MMRTRRRSPWLTAALCFLAATVSSAALESKAAAQPSRAGRTAASGAVPPLQPSLLRPSLRTAVGRSAFPPPANVRRARLWLSGRTGFLGFAVIDSGGRLHGWHAGRVFISGSVTKAMMLVQYLRTHPTLSPFMRRMLTSMIEVSDNDAADVVYTATGGDAGLRRVAALAGMRHFTAERGYWGYALITAADQARLFYRLNRLVPAPHRSFARKVLSHVVACQSYGIPAVARPQWRVYFKGGWRTGLHGGRLVHQAARLECQRQVVAVAVLTDGSPTVAYAVHTIEEVTRRLLGRQTTRSGSRATQPAPAAGSADTRVPPWRTARRPP